ncbi:unnamed protein product [Ambrosiozyma monospora]|uniref:Unnamed protein product n=1 Tax=Ambrosiozyma monospora TaxID=43982 RepID=A0ACB5SWM1_AMBMO|nr:unnamed protein product [Ambrosiozyma monospora]
MMKLDFDVFSDIDSVLSFDADNELSLSTGSYPSIDPLSCQCDEDNNYATDELQTSIEDQFNYSVISLDMPSAIENTITENISSNTSNINYSNSHITNNVNKDKLVHTNSPKKVDWLPIEKTIEPASVHSSFSHSKELNKDIQ